jgi:hypothetical protein
LGRWSGFSSGFDGFWLVLGVVLIGAVVLVASVAHTSMDKVGTPALKIESQARPKQTPRPVAGTIVIVQVSSYTSKSIAVESARKLISQGFAAHVLESNRYRPLNRGYYVVYLGSFPASAQGRANAKKVQVRIPGALVRDIQAR